MNVQALAVTMLLLVLLCSVPALSGVLGSQASNLQRQAEAGLPEEAPWPPGDGGDRLPGQGSERRTHPLASAWKVMREAHPSSRSLSKATGRALLGSGEQVAPGKPWRLPLQPSRSRTARLSHHLKDYGKFNSDTVSTAALGEGLGWRAAGWVGHQSGSDRRAGHAEHAMILQTPGRKGVFEAIPLKMHVKGPVTTWPLSTAWVWVLRREWGRDTPNPQLVPGKA